MSTHDLHNAYAAGEARGWWDGLISIALGALFFGLSSHWSYQLGAKFEREEAAKTMICIARPAPQSLRKEDMVK